MLRIKVRFPVTNPQSFDNKDRKLKKVKIISHKIFLVKILLYLIFYKFILNVLRIIFLVRRLIYENDNRDIMFKTSFEQLPRWIEKKKRNRPIKKTIQKTCY